MLSPGRQPRGAERRGSLNPVWSLLSSPFSSQEEPSPLRPARGKRQRTALDDLLDQLEAQWPSEEPLQETQPHPSQRESPWSQEEHGHLHDPLHITDGLMQPARSSNGREPNVVHNSAGLGSGLLEDLILPSSQDDDFAVALPSSLLMIPASPQQYLTTPDSDVDLVESTQAVAHERHSQTPQKEAIETAMQPRPMALVPTPLAEAQRGLHSRIAEEDDSTGATFVGHLARTREDQTCLAIQQKSSGGRGEVFISGEKSRQDVRGNLASSSLNFVSLTRPSVDKRDNGLIEQSAFDYFVESPVDDVERIEPHSVGTPELHLEAYLPPELATSFQLPGQLLAWQAECLAVLKGRSSNLIYTAPTSAGNSLVSEILVLRSFLQDEHQRFGLLVLPYRSLCEEKSRRFRQLLAPAGRKVVEYWGGKHNFHPARAVDEGEGSLIVTTIEKANALIDEFMRLGQEPSSRFNCIIIDELHMLNDPERGETLEILLAKLRYSQRRASALIDRMTTLPTRRDLGKEFATPPPRNAALSHLHTPSKCSTHQPSTPLPATLSGSPGTSRHPPACQLIGMSATLSNADAIGRWLDAAVYTCTVRPVPLRQFIEKPDKTGRHEIWEVSDGGDCRYLRQVPALPHMVAATGRKDCVAELCQETVSEGHSVLVFCGSKTSCESTAKQLKRLLDCPEIEASRTHEETIEDQPSSSSSSSAAEDSPRHRSAKSILCAQLSRLTTPYARQLADLITAGIAFHHADLASVERELVEDGFRSGAIRVLLATSTLAAGVNLPARRVIFKHAYVSTPIRSNWLSGIRYCQMAGRAGRMGLDDCGEAFLLSGMGVPETYLVELAMGRGTEDVSSCLGSAMAMSRAVLEAIGSGAVTTAEDVQTFMESTLLCRIQGPALAANLVKEALAWLCREALLIAWDRGTGEWRPTQLGAASARGFLKPQDVLQLREDLDAARQCLVLSSDLHLCYLCVNTKGEWCIPMRYAVEPNWPVLWRCLSALPSNDCRVAEIVGLSQRLILEQCQTGGSRSLPPSASGSKTSATEPASSLITCCRFFAALLLRDLVAEKPLESVQHQYGISSVQLLLRLQEEASQYAGSVASFASELGWADLAAILQQFRPRVTLGTRSDIVGLAQVPGLGRTHARLLYAAGLARPEDVHAADITAVVSAIGKGPKKKPSERHAIAAYRTTAKMIKQCVAKFLEEQDQGGGLTTEADAVVGDLKQSARNDDDVEGDEMCDKVAEVAAPPRNLAICTRTDSASTSNRLPPTPSIRAPSLRAASAASVRPPVLVQGKSFIGSDSTEITVSTVNANPKLRMAVEKLHGPSQDTIEPLPANKQACQQISSADCLDIQKDDRLLQQLHAQLQRHSPCLDEKSFVGIAFHLRHAVQGGRAQSRAMPRSFQCQPGSERIPEETPPSEEPPFLFIAGYALCWDKGQRIAYFEANQTTLQALGMVLSHSSATVLCYKNLKHQQKQLLRLTALDQSTVGQQQRNDIYSVILDPLVTCLDAYMTTNLLGAGLEEVTDPNKSGGEIDEDFAEGIVLRSADKRMETGASHAAQRFASVDRASLLPKGLTSGGRACCLTAMEGLAVCLRHATKLQMREALFNHLVNVEPTISRVLAEMERSGVSFDMDKASKLHVMLQQRIDEVQRTLIYLGARCDLGSSRDVGRLLFEDLGLPKPPTAMISAGGGGTKRTDHTSTKASVLADLLALPGLSARAEQIVRLVLDHRKASDSDSYIAGLIRLATTIGKPCPGNPSFRKLRSTWYQMGTPTGRIISEEPNLQCMPKTHTIRQTEVVNIRSCIVADEGSVLISADYKQLEYRLIAHLSKDKALSAALQRRDQDPFVHLGCLIYGLSEKEITADVRAKTKQLTYGILYGVGNFSLARALSCTPAEAGVLKKQVLASLGSVTTWQQECIGRARRAGFIETLRGNRRTIPNLNSSNRRDRSAAERAVVNSIPQGSAADIVKGAMARLAQAAKHSLPCCRPALQIHDELVFQVPLEYQGQAARMIKECMETEGSELDVPLFVEVSIGPSWGELKPIALP